jgi:hypothetical protein
MVIAGGLGYYIGIDGSSEHYDKFPGFFMCLGIVHCVWIFMAGLVLIVNPIYDWVEKGGSRETRTEAYSTDSTVRRYETAPTASVQKTVHHQPPNVVPSELSRRAYRESLIRFIADSY